MKFDLTVKDLERKQVEDLLARIDKNVPTVQNKIDENRVEAICEHCGLDIYVTSKKNPEKTLEWSEKQFLGHVYCYNCQQKLKEENEEE